jgi:hypothetical protein
MNPELQAFSTYIESGKNDLNIHRQVSFELNCSESTLDIIDKIIALVTSIEEKATAGNFQINYLNQFRSNIDSILNALPFRGQKNTAFIPQQNENWIELQRKNIENNSINFVQYYDQLNFNIDFFTKIGFFNNNVVAIGANGSGKTTLSNKFKSYLKNNGVVISAQRILLVPSFDSISNPAKTANELKQSQLRDKTNKNDGEFRYLQQEFSVVLKNLLADNISEGNSFRKKAIELVKAGKEMENPRLTNLDNTFQIWN